MPPSSTSTKCYSDDDVKILLNKIGVDGNEPDKYQLTDASAGCVTCLSGVIESCAEPVCGFTAGDARSCGIGCTYTAPVVQVAEACADTNSSGDDCTGFSAGNAESCGSCDYIAPVTGVTEMCDVSVDCSFTVGDPSTCNSTGGCTYGPGVDITDAKGTLDGYLGCLPDVSQRMCSKDEIEEILRSPVPVPKNTKCSLCFNKFKLNELKKVCSDDDFKSTVKMANCWQKHGPEIMGRLDEACGDPDNPARSLADIGFRIIIGIIIGILVIIGILAYRSRTSGTSKSASN